MVVLSDIVGWMDHKNKAQVWEPELYSSPSRKWCSESIKKWLHLLEIILENTRSWSSFNRGLLYLVYAGLIDWIPSFELYDKILDIKMFFAYFPFRIYKGVSLFASLQCLPFSLFTVLTCSPVLRFWDTYRILKSPRIVGRIGMKNFPKYFWNEALKSPFYTTQENWGSSPWLADIL